ncbi:hypothetical protein [Streptomyces sp. NBC_00385]|uniref:hypothetical protein n=1 Tax=Streptomyces sp. NBC_00385 TaxID=2975733 RepID=UPI002DD84CD2|nr:hypothetical protein [Streptomyces sp. NBC_00385]
MLWPAGEPWPVCSEAHGRGRGRRPADIRRYRQVLASAWAREPVSGPTDEERELLGDLHRDHRIAGAAETDPLPMVGLAQLYRRDVPDLPAGPGDCDLPQVFWCPFNAHGPGRYDLEVHLRWRRSWEVGEALTAPPQPLVVGSDGFVPGPCVLYPEQVVTYPDAGLLPEELCSRIDAWEEALEGDAEQSADGTTAEPLGYQYDLSIPSGWRGGFASWHATDPYPMGCLVCTTPMSLLLTIDSSEWDGEAAAGSRWRNGPSPLTGARLPPRSPSAAGVSSTCSPAPAMLIIHIAGAFSSLSRASAVASVS